MADVTIIQVSLEDLSNLIETAVKNAVETMLPKPEKVTDDKEIPMLSVNDMCRILKIGRTRFEAYKADLVKSGMFKIGKRNSSYLMRKEDFEKWLDSKHRK